MIKVDYFKKADSIVKFVMDGHALFSDDGDIVCASASSAAWMCLNGIEQKLGLAYGCETGDGYIYFVLPDDITDEERIGTDILLDSFYLFMKELESQYPDYIKVTELEV